MRLARPRAARRRDRAAHRSRYSCFARVVVVVVGGVCTRPRSTQAVDDDCELSDDEDSDGPELSFPELERAIDVAVDALGGLAFVKLNWSAPRDATWLSGSLECRCAADAFALLKASEFVAHDVGHAYSLCGDSAENPDSPERLTLALREWRERPRRLLPPPASSPRERSDEIGVVQNERVLS